MRYAVHVPVQMGFKLPARKLINHYLHYSMFWFISGGVFDQVKFA